METGLADFINASTKHSQVKHGPCLKYAKIYRPNLQNLQTRKNGWSNLLKVEIGLSNYVSTKQTLISTLHKYAQTKMYVLLTRHEVCRPEKS